MGDFSQQIAAPRVERNRAAQLAADIEVWLVSQKIAALPKSDNVLGAEEGLQPGENAELACVMSDGRVPRELWTNGISVSFEPQIYHLSQDLPETFDFICSNCDNITSSDDFLEKMGDAFENWTEEEHAGIECASCGTSPRLTDWRSEPPCFQASNLGITIWNWPTLSKQFLNDLLARLEGEIVYMAGKL